jgi:hypothetical protein
MTVTGQPESVTYIYKCTWDQVSLTGDDNRICNNKKCGSIHGDPKLRQKEVTKINPSNVTHKHQYRKKNKEEK